MCSANTNVYTSCFVLVEHKRTVPLCFPPVFLCQYKDKRSKIKIQKTNRKRYPLLRSKNNGRLQNRRKGYAYYKT